MIKTLEKARTDNWTKRKFFEGTSAKIGASIDQTGLPVTGITAAEEKKFEKDLGLPQGTLARTSPYWTEFVIIVDSEGVRLDDEIPEHQLKIKFLEAQSLVAKGTKEMKTNPRAEYILKSEEEEIKARVSVKRKRNNALKLAMNMDLEEKRKMFYMYNLDPNSMSEEAIEDFIIDRAEVEPEKFTLLANDPGLDTKVFINKLVKKGIISILAGAYRYNDEVIAYGLDATAQHLDQKKNQDLRIALEKQLKE